MVPYPSSYDYEVQESFDDLPIGNYELILDDISRNSLSIPIQNKDKQHASLLMKYLFNETVASLNIYVNKFSGIYSSSPDYIASLEACLDRSVEVNVLLDQQPNNGSKAYKMIYEHINQTRKGKIGIATDESKKIIGELFIESKPLHYAVSDEKRYRIETDPILKTAYASFNDKYLASKLTKTFDKALSKSQIIQ